MESALPCGGIVYLKQESEGRRVAGDNQRLTGRTVSQAASEMECRQVGECYS